MDNVKILSTGSDFLTEILEVIHRSDNIIRISTFRFENPENIKSKELDHLFLALAVARQRKVKINVLVNLYEKASRLGQINKRTAGHLQGKGCNVRRPTGNIVNHAKLIISDERTLIIGSHNLTRYSFTKNFEVSLSMQHHAIIQKTIKTFDNAFSTASKV